tara:strand:+ start:10746 stop:11726 length:981 start_codon:yes stop_codon:yes gene_type:complete
LSKRTPKKHKPSSIKRRQAEKASVPRVDWVFLRGLGRQSGHWFRFRKLLESESTFPFNGTLHFPDLPGTGKQNQKRSPASISEITDVLRQKTVGGAIAGVSGKGTGETPRKVVGEAPYETADATVLTQNTGRGASKGRGPLRCLFAISLGGMVALDWLHRYPEDFDCAFIVNSSMKGLSPFYHRMRPGAALDILKAVYHGLLRKDIESMESAVFGRSCNNEDTQSLAHWIELQNRYPVRFSNFLRQLWAALRFRAPAADFPPPVFLVSRNDRLVNPACSDALFRRFGRPGRYFVHPFAGHDLTTDDPEGTAEFLRLFLGRFLDAAQ